MKKDRLHWLFLRLMLEGMFRLGWPLAARLPPALGHKIAVVLGNVCGHLDLDWRTIGLRRHYVAAATREAYHTMDPTLNARQLDALVRARFQQAAREELEGHWLALGRSESFDCDFEGLNEVRVALAQGKGLVLLTMHFDAALMGVAQLGLAGVKLNLMTSNVVKDARVPSIVRRYFAAKYAGIEASLNGGQALHVETHLRSFYRDSQSGVATVILGEAPTGNLADALVADFLGRRRAIAPGAVRLAESNGAPISAFLCFHTQANRYRVIFAPVYWPDATGSQRDNAARLFAFFDAHVRAAPERWWAADQLPNFVNLDA